MKKSIIAASVIVVLGASYTIASWYTGNIIENKFDKTINKFTQSINAQKGLYDIDIQYDDYQKGIFSTSVHLKINAISIENSQYSFTFDDTVTIYHGPFPWSQIKSANLAPKMAAIYYETTKESHPQLWAAAGNKPFINMHSVIDYSENIDIEIINQPAKYLDEEGSFEWSTTTNTLSISTDARINSLRYDSTIERLEYQDYLNDSRVLAQNLSLSGKFSLQNDVDYNLAQYFTIENLTLGNAEDKTITENNAHAFNINQFTIVSDSVKQNQQTVDEISASINRLTFGQQDLGKGEILVSHNTSSKNYLSTTQNDSFTIENSVIKLNKLLWQTSQGNLDARFVVDIEGESFELNQLYEDNVNFAEIKANLPLKTLAYLVAQVSNPDKSIPDENDINDASKMVLLFSGLFLMNSPIIDLQYDVSDDIEDGIFVDLYYSKGEKRARLKGQEVTTGQFWQALSRNRLQF